MEDVWTTISDWLAVYGWKILGAVILFIVGRIVISIIVSTFGKIMKKSGTDETLSKFLKKLPFFELTGFLLSS